MIGLDFGTTYSKVVVRELAGMRAWAVPLSSDAVNPYLLCARLWRQGDHFSLLPEGQALGNLKLDLVAEQTPPDALINATAYVALLLRHVKAWFWRTRSAEFHDVEPIWLTHMGLPVSNLEQEQVVERFRSMLWAAMLVSDRLDRRISDIAVRDALAHVDIAIASGRNEVQTDDGDPVHSDQVALFPEVAAQIYGYFRSDRRDPSLNRFLLADVGGGTVDAGLFGVNQCHDGQEEFVFHAAAVKPLGVYTLHHERLAWHVDQLERYGGHQCADAIVQLSELRRTGASPIAVPGSADDYLEGVEYPDETCDRRFANDFGTMLWRHVVMAASKQTGRPVAGDASLPFLLCGGGRSIEIYKHFARRINARDSSTQLRLREIDIGRPSDLEPRSIDGDVFHRLSVAYGLSFDTIGDVITPSKLPPPPPESSPPDISDNYVSNDQC